MHVLKIENTFQMNKHKLKIQCFIHEKYNCHLHDFVLRTKHVVYDLRINKSSLAQLN